MIVCAEVNGEVQEALKRGGLGEEVYSVRALVGAVLGPLLAVALWFSPLGLAPLPQHALAIVAFMAVYWIAEPIDHGLTALTGCFLFWALHIVTFESAFSGFADSTPWFLYGGMLMGEAAARSGLARRIGLLVIRLIGTSYDRLLLSVIVLALVLNFLVPNGMAQVAIVAPILIGIVAAFGVDRLSNIGRGLFVILTYTCGLFNKMILAGGSGILTRGMVEKMTGKTIYWTQFFVAYLPSLGRRRNSKPWSGCFWRLVYGAPICCTISIPPWWLWEWAWLSRCQRSACSA